MDARSQCDAIPLAVDLDGTLIATNLLWESLFLLLRQRPHCALLLPFWLTGGKARLKCEIAERVVLDPADLPYRKVLLARLMEERARGRRIVLATASPRKFAEAVATNMGIFDTVISTERGCNMASHVKRDALIKAFGDGGFHYAGDSRADIAVFAAANGVLVVAPDRAAARWHAKNKSELFSAEEPTLKRAHQWLKNTLIFVPLILMREYLNVGLLGACALAFVSFSAAASAIYILNDFFDLLLDRRHPSKCHRPFASGVVSVRRGAVTMVALLAISIGTALFLPPLFMLVLGAYLLATCAYSMAIKRMLLVDVLTLAGLYTLRILAGAHHQGCGRKGLHGRAGVPDFSQTLPAVLTPVVGMLDDKLKGSLSGFVGALLLRDHDVLVAVTEYNCNVIRLEPPLIVERSHVDAFVDALDTVLRRGVVAIVKDFVKSQII